MPLIRDGVRETLVDLHGLPRGVRALVLLGYGCVFGLLATTLLLELFGGRLLSVDYSTPAGPTRVPLLAMIVSSVALAVGWAFVLTGASDCGRRLFFPLAGLFGLELFIVLAGDAELSPAIWFLALLLIAGVLAVPLLTHRSRRWRELPVREYLGWLALGTVAVGWRWLFREGDPDVALTLEGAFTLLWLLTFAFWMLLGLDVVELAVKLARWAVVRLRRRLSEGALRALVPVVLVARPLIAGLLATIVGDRFWLFDVAVSIPLVVSALGLWLARRWTVRAAATLLALSLASPVITLGLSLALGGGQDFTEWALSASGLIPPSVLFVGLLTYDVLSFGARYTSAEGRLMPRTGRTLVYLGAAILATGFAIFFSNVRRTGGELHYTMMDAIGGQFAMGLVFLGPLYLAWLTWRRRERLVGD